IYGDAAGALPNRITATYIPIGGVAIDLKGNTGKITGGDISVDFFRQLVSLNSLVVAMGDRSFTYSSSPVSNILIAPNGSFSDSGVAACTLGCIDTQTTFSAGGAFTGADAQGIALHYDLVNISDQITGVEGFLRTNYKPVTAGVLTAYAGLGTTLYSVADNDAIRLPTERTLAGGNLDAYSTASGDSASIGANNIAVDIGTGIGGPAGDHFGRWDGGSITGNSVADANLQPPQFTPASGVHYLYTAALTLPEVIAARTGTVNFNHAGGTNPTDHTGGVGTFNSGNLDVNFTNHTAAMNANWTIGTNAYNLSTTPLILVVDGGGVNIGASLANHAGSFCTACSNLIIDQVNIQGNFSGAAGNTINMAISTFDAGAAAAAPVTSASVQVFQEGPPPVPQ
ncbi:MAG: hypothetical protein ABL858_03020, partial [Candidatus Nitrotoga sp.]